MGFWEDSWHWLKGAVKDVADVATTIAPVAAMFLKKGGLVVPDTPANRKKFLAAFNKHHKTKLSMKMANEIINSKGGKKLRLA